MDLQYSEEKFTDIQSEIEALSFEHWQEVTNSPHIAVDPDWQKFADLDAINVLHVLAIRDGAKLVGYVMIIMVPMLHYKTVLLAHDDAYFLQKQYRNGFAGVKMFTEAEKMMKAKGAHQIIFHEKARVKTGPIFQYLGYKAGDVLWMKEF